jgi:two-component system cell cycle response regulator
MPNMDGMQLCTKIRQDLDKQDIPIIVLTAMSDLSEILEVFKVGDAVLIRFVKNLQTSIRSEMDWIARYGGEEFLIVLPETSVSNAQVVAEKLRKAVSDQPIRCETEHVRITASFGITGFDPETQTSSVTLEKILKAADENLYLARNEGRDRDVSSLL